MLIKKLAVPLINDKLLMQAEYCYIATAAISEEAFDFVKSRLPPKCKIEIVTGLDALTSPGVLRRIWRHYQDRITLHIYTKNIFQANVYIFDLPYRKAIAFTGSGNFTLGGLKDNEEIFWKVTDPKDIESLKSWFTGYAAFSVPLTEQVIQEYELIYPSMKQREIVTSQEKQQFIALTASGFNWDSIRFKNQYFKKEDFLTFGNNKAQLNTETILKERTSVQNKLLQLHESVKEHVKKSKLLEDADGRSKVSSTDPALHPGNKVRSMKIVYGTNKTSLKSPSSPENLRDLITIEIVIGQIDVGIYLVAGSHDSNKGGRRYFYNQMLDAEYRSTYYKLISALDAGYWIETAGEKKPVRFFQDEVALWEFIKADEEMHYAFIIGKNYSPGDTEISNENITTTIIREFDKLALVYRHMEESRG